MKASTIIGGLVGGAIDRRKGDDSSLDGALIGAGVVVAARVIVPVAVTFAVGWLALRGLGKLTDSVLGPRPAKG
ncbi:hypothetical protein NDN01_01280 [Sphingomonas sp. QA11]|uniref:hypothetical protein n=1 Tax=Sphingomonas sp. QA11 TaxID=2950605 RepID=UPI00234BE6A3|nr:hypothetical protein [Sphingomonas sp. QA11]WCM27595.1 hypothetical protein NDN01_01280 [Sphingomonas sp. QA11]